MKEEIRLKEIERLNNLLDDLDNDRVVEFTPYRWTPECAPGVKNKVREFIYDVLETLYE